MACFSLPWNEIPWKAKCWGARNKNKLSVPRRREAKSGGVRESLGGGGGRGHATARPHTVPSPRRLCAAGPRAPRPTSRTPGLGAWGLFPPTGDSPEPSGLCLLGLRRHEPRVHGHGETGSGEPPQVERTPCFSTEAKEGEAAGPRSCPSPCACDPGPPVGRLVAVVTAPVSRALAPCPLRATRSTSTSQRPLQCPAPSTDEQRGPG